MKDIDFDELDRAVSSVLGQSPVKDEPATEVQVVDDKTEDSDSSPVTVTAIKQEQSETTNASSPAPRSSSTPSLAIKRRGKFMDVMHPSADMAPVSQSPKPVRSLSPLTPTEVEKDTTQETEPSEDSSIGIEANAHEPTASLDETTVPVGAEPTPIEALLPDHVQDTGAQDTSVSPSDASAEPGAESATETNPEESESSSSSPSMYVDPLSIADKNEEVPAEEPLSPTEEQKSEGDIQASFPESAPEVSAELVAQPTPTPFLSDTNVDKRPLGAFVGSEQNAEVGESTSSASLQPAMAMPGDAQSAPSVPLPRELQPDVVEVESVQEPEATPSTTANNDGRVEGHPLFDTSTYHEPIAAVHSKGMAAWVKWMIGLLLCLVVGAGVGYFLFAAGL